MQMRTDRIIRGLMGGALLLPLSAWAASYANLTIPFTIENPQTTCSLKINGQTSLNYDLGKLNAGSEKEHNNVTVNVTCTDGTVKTAIMAKLLSGGVLQSDNSVRMQVDGVQPDDSKAPLLWLENGGQRIRLTALQGDEFCEHASTSSSSPNICQLKPYTRVPSGSPSGKLNLTLQLNVVYPQ